MKKLVISKEEFALYEDDTFIRKIDKEELDFQELRKVFNYVSKRVQELYEFMMSPERLSQGVQDMWFGHHLDLRIEWDAILKEHEEDIDFCFKLAPTICLDSYTFHRSQFEETIAKIRHRISLIDWENGDDEALYADVGRRSWS